MEHARRAAHQRAHTQRRIPEERKDSRGQVITNLRITEIGIHGVRSRIWELPESEFIHETLHRHSRLFACGATRICMNAHECLMNYFWKIICGFMDIRVAPQAFWQFAAARLSVSERQTAAFRKRFHWFRSTIPLVLLNNSIDFVQQIHWLCFVKLPFSLVPTVVFNDSFCRFSIEEQPSHPIISNSLIRDNQVATLSISRISEWKNDMQTKKLWFSNSWQSSCALSFITN